MAVRRQEPVLERPALADDRPLRVSRLVRGNHLLDGGIAHRVCRRAPAQAVDLLHHLGVAVGGRDLNALEGAVLAVGFRIGLAHQTALEPTVHHELDAGHAHPLVALVRLQARSLDDRADARCRGRAAAWAEDQRADAHRQHPATLHLFEQPVLRDGDAAEPDAGQTRGVELRKLTLLLHDLLVERHLGSRRQRHQVARRVDQLPVGFAVGVLAHLPAVRIGRPLGDVPLRERRRVQDVLVTATNQHDRGRGRYAVKIAPEREPVLLEL